MAGNRPRSWAHAVHVDTIEIGLSFAVGLVDGVTGGRPTGDVVVRLADAPVEPVVNPRGYRLFLDVVPEYDPVTVTVDGGDRYVDESVTVYHDSDPPDGAAAVDARDPRVPVEVTLTPTPAYPFASGTTLLRGFVTDTPIPADGSVPAGSGVGGATVAVPGVPDVNGSVAATTTDSGEYVLPLNVSGDRVIRGPDERWVRTPGGNGGGPGNGNDGSGDQFDPPTHEVTVKHPDGATESVAEIPLRAGGVTKHDVVLR